MKKFLFFILCLGLLVSFGNEGWYKLLKMKRIASSLAEENRLLAEYNLTLIKEISDLKDPEYLEKYIREELGFAKDNEMLYHQSP